MSHRIARRVISQAQRLLFGHYFGDPQLELSPERVVELELIITEAGMHLEDEDDSAGAYEHDDPKHSTYRERALDNADYERKRRREED